MDYALKERIGKPELFTGRKEELSFFLKWINDIKDEKSMSTAILARRKMGKTAILERLFNIIFSNNNGIIKATWMEYVQKAFSKVNDRNAKRIVLHLFKQKGRELTRTEIKEQLKLEMSDNELEKKLEALVKGDILEQGVSNFRFRAVTDNIFDKVFRGVYQDEIEHFEVGEIKKEYSRKVAVLEARYRELQGKYNYHMGLFAEYLILEKLRMQVREKNDFFKSITRYLPGDFNFCFYSRVWRYDSSPAYSQRYNVDIFAHAQNPGDYSIIGEVKNRDHRKFSREEALAFERKFQEVKKNEQLDRVVGFVFSRSGFTQEAEDYCREKGIACSEDEKWLE